MAGASQGSLPFLYNDFSGGLNTLDAYDLLTDNEARDLLNVQGTTAGAIAKRTGLQTLGTPANPLTSLFSLESISPVMLVGAGGTVLYSISSGGTITTIATALTSNLRWEFVSAPIVSAQGPLFGMNGTDTPKQWSGVGSAGNWTNATGAVAVPNGKYCVYHQNQVFVTGVSTSPSRLYWSAIADPTNWDPASLKGAGFMDFDPTDGQAITALGTVGPYLLVCKPRKMWILIDAATAQSRRLSDDIGCVAHRSLASGPEGTFFLAEDRGVFVTNGSKVTPISDKITPTIDSMVGPRSQAAGAYINAHYYLSVPLNSTANDTVLDFDSKLTSWWKHTFGTNQFALWHPQGTVALFAGMPGGFSTTTAVAVGGSPTSPVSSIRVNPVSTAAGVGTQCTIGTDTVTLSASVRAGSTNLPIVPTPLNFYASGTTIAVVSSVAQCFTPNVFTDNGQPISWLWRGPWQSPTFYRRRRFPTPYFRKRLRQVRFNGIGTVDFSVAKDFASVGTLVRANAFGAAGAADTFAGAGTYGGSDGSLFGGAATVQRARILAGFGVANAFSMVFGATSTTQDQIFSYTLLVTDRRDLIVA